MIRALLVTFLARLADVPADWLGALFAGGGAAVALWWLVFLVGVCCCTATGSGDCSTTNCNCPSYPLTYTVAVSGIANNTCAQADCPNLNMTHTLAHITGICAWTQNNSPRPCLSGSDTYLACCETGSEAGCTGTSAVRELTLMKTGANVANYRLASSSWSCLGENTLTRNSSHPDCSNWPASLTVVPA